MPNDPKDRHVLAAAVATGAQIIITDNLADFPSGSLHHLGVTAQSADAFLIDIYQADPNTLTRIVQRQAADLRAPAMTADELLLKIARQAPTFAALVGERLSQSS